MTPWLLGRGPLPHAATLRATKLAAYAYTVLPQSHVERGNLRADYVASLGRHQRLKAELQPLVRAWRGDGIDVLIFKGFQLSEFVYPRPGARFHGDVDILLRPQQLERAEQIAVALGWHVAHPVIWRARPNHNAFCLGRPNGTARIDVHREILHVSLPWHPAQRRITAAVWDAARARSWDGVEIREPAPVDMLLVGLVLQRCWSGEQWHLKPHDILDFRAITARYGLTNDALRERARERARELRCERTLAAFLDRCDPVAGRLDLAPVSPHVRRRLQRRVFLERGPLGRTEYLLSRLGGAAPSALLALRYIPLVLRVRHALRRQSDPRAVLATLTANDRRRAERRAPARMPRHLIAAGINWAIRVVGTGPFGVCLVRTLAAFVALRRQGEVVEFVSGVRRDGPTIVGHAWLERDGMVLMELDSSDLRATFEESFRSPAASTAALARGQAPAGTIPDARATSAPRPRTPHG